MATAVLQVMRGVALTVTIFGPALADEKDILAEALELTAIRSAFLAATDGSPEIPDLVGNAFMFVEDREFLEGFPAWSILTATIAQWYPPHKDETALGRRSRKLRVSIAVANALTHKEILIWYMDGIHLGLGCYGVASAAVAYFGKPPVALNVEQIALLAGLPLAPTAFHPTRRPEKALERRNFVLKAMAKEGLISDTLAESAAAKPLGLRDPLGSCKP